VRSSSPRCTTRMWLPLDGMTQSSGRLIDGFIRKSFQYMSVGLFPSPAERSVAKGGLSY
jgi:hypothetical protein